MEAYKNWQELIGNQQYVNSRALKVNHVFVFPGIVAFTSFRYHQEKNRLILPDQSSHLNINEVFSFLDCRDVSRINWTLHRNPTRPLRHRTKNLTGEILIVRLESKDIKKTLCTEPLRTPPRWRMERKRRETPWADKVEHWKQVVDPTLSCSRWQQGFRENDFKVFSPGNPPNSCNLKPLIHLCQELSKTLEAGMECHNTSSLFHTVAK